MDSPDTPALGSYQGMVDNLVTQFSSALDCFRELVQNSIDAGSPRIDIWMEFLPGDGHEGTIAIHVEDFGEGMDEAIIDNEFTQLFASTKDDDLTKIGKFGIGFVSVFAMEPRAVLVHTGRSGEYWEVCFHEDRSFSKTRVDNPIEGTQITLFLQGEYHRYEELAEQIPATLKHWCSHSTAEVTFEDRTNNTDFAPPLSINEDFGVDGDCLQFVDFEGTEIALAYSEKPIYGFYNRGLTLALTDIGDNVLSRWKDRFEFISFKIKSRYLEHTLARDSVIQDKQYEQAMQLLERAANEQLLGALIDELERIAAQPTWGVEDFHRYNRLMGFLAEEPFEQLVPHLERPILRCFDGRAINLFDAWNHLRDRGRLLVARESTPLIEALAKQEIPVLVGTSGHQGFGVGDHRAFLQLLTWGILYQSSRSARGLLWRAAGGLRSLVSRQESGPTEERVRRSIKDPATVYYPIAVDDDVDPELAPLIDAARTLLQNADTGVRLVATGTISGTPDESPLYVIGPRVEPLMARHDKNLFEEERRLEAVVNRHHPQFEIIAALHESDPAMAAYLLARGLSLCQDHKLDADRAMLHHSLDDVRQQFS